MPVFEPKSKEEFEAKLKEAKGPVVVDFVADGCGACDPESLDKLATDCENSATVMRVEVNSEFGGVLADQFKVTGTPTTMLAESAAQFTPDEATEIDPGSTAVRRKLKCSR